ncbi:MAG TPA: hypothetical protein VHE59_00770 [Mucilaginibacter sp.]|nr:hypothetical protein [Mucilaginibacter sp.]
MYRLIFKKMLTTILEITGLIAILVVPAVGPQKKKNKEFKIDRDVAHAHYAIDEEGNLVELHGRELSRYEH